MGCSLNETVSAISPESRSIVILLQSTYENFTPSGKLSPTLSGWGAASSGEVSVDMVGSLDFLY